MAPSPFTAAIPDFTGRMIDNGRLRLVNVIGEGAHGVVYRAVEEASAESSSAPAPREYAVKVQIKAAVSAREGQCQTREVSIHKLASDHPNVVTLHHVIEDDKFVYIITDYCPGGDFFTLMIDQAKYARDNELAKKIFVQLLDAVQSLHNKGVYHRDLKPENLFANSDGTELYLGDFGLATEVLKSDGFGCGSMYYMSPECIGVEFNYAPYATDKADVWALGVILVNLITGRSPWKLATMQDEDFFKYMADNDYLRKTLPIPEAANDLLKQMLSFNPHARITIAEAKEELMGLDALFLTEKEAAIASNRIRNVYAGYVPHVLEKKVLDVVVQQEKADDGAAYPNILAEDVYALVGPNPYVASASPSASLSASHTVGSARDDLPSMSSSGSRTGSSGTESSGPRTPETSAVDDGKIVSSPESLQGLGLGMTFGPAAPAKGPTPIHCLVQGIEEIELF